MAAPVVTLRIRDALRRLAMPVLIVSLLVVVLTSCAGRWHLAPPPDTGVPTVRKPPRAGHAHVHVPGEVRGERLAPVFARSVSVTLYRQGRWIADSASVDSVLVALETLAPTHVSSLFRFTPGELPTERHVHVWRQARARLARVRPDVRFDIALDALAYTSGPDVVAHLRALDEHLAPDLWTFVGWDEADRVAYDVVASATAQAHANGQAIGGVTASAEIGSDSDFGVLMPSVDARVTRQRLQRLRRFHDLPYLVLRVPGSAGGTLAGAGRCFYSWRLAVPASAIGFGAMALRDSLATAPRCQPAPPPPR